MQFSKIVAISNAVLSVLALGFLFVSCSYGDEVSGESASNTSTYDSHATVQSKDHDRKRRQTIVREGVVVEFEVLPARKGVDRVMASDWAEIVFHVTDAETGESIKGRYPAAWMDLSKAWEAKGDKPMSCADRVQTYLQGIVGVRPMVDLNSYFLLVLNADATISVIDPVVGITGVTNLFAQINLDMPGADWAKTEDQKQLFVTMPEAGQVAVIDSDHFKVTGNIDAGELPTRAELQGDGRFLWVGNNTADPERSGVTIIDPVEQRPVAFIATGAGHHEIAFSDDDRYTFVSNRNSGTVTVIDVQQREKLKDIRVGGIPLSLAYSKLSKELYIADARSGDIDVVDGNSHEIRTVIKTRPGLGPMRFDNDGRWGIVVNPSEDMVFVIDSSKDEVIHNIPVGKQPYQVMFTRSFAYVRSLGTEKVGLIPTSELGGIAMPPVTYIVAGNGPPGAAAKISMADSIVPSAKEAAAYIVNQAEGTVHYYMEGMVAPMGAFRNYGHEARAIEIVDRSLTEREPGIYTGTVKLPTEGEYDVAFMMDSPRFLHCFSAEVAPNPKIKQTSTKLSVEFLNTERFVSANNDIAFRFKLVNPGSGTAIEDVNDVTVLFYRSDGRDRNVVSAKQVEQGIYQATIRLNTTSVYYVFVGSRSRNAGYSDMPFFSLKSIDHPAEGAAPEVTKPAGGGA